MDQGSVVVLCRRVFLSAEIPDHPDMDHDLNYSGAIPTATTLIPDPCKVVYTSSIATRRDQGSVLIVYLSRLEPHWTYNQKLSQLIIIG